MSSAFGAETVLEVRHWTDAYFSFTTTRDSGFRFENGQFVMIGLETEARPLLRAYSIASANWEEHLEFFSIKVQDGPLTSRLQHQARRQGAGRQAHRHPADQRPAPGQEPVPAGHGHRHGAVAVGHQDPETYERFEKVILCHGVRYEKDLAYRDYFERELREHEFLGEMIGDKLLYYPAVTREPFANQGRLTSLMESGQMQRTLGLPELSPENDRAMICGSPQMLADLRAVLDARGFQVSPRIGQPGHYVFERAFVEK